MVDVGPDSKTSKLTELVGAWRDLPPKQPEINPVGCGENLPLPRDGTHHRCRMRLGHPTHFCVAVLPTEVRDVGV